MKKLESKLKIYYQTKQKLDDAKLANKNLRRRKWFFFRKKKVFKSFFFKQKSNKTKKGHEQRRTIKWVAIKKSKLSKQKQNVRPIKIKLLYKERLLNRQKFKYFYGCLNNKQLKNEFNKITALSFKIDNLIMNLEQRLDLLLYRTRLFKSLFDIQQKISHNLIKLNYSSNTFKNHKMKVGDYVWLSNSCGLFKSNLLPVHLEWSPKLRICVLIKEPTIPTLKYPFKFNKQLLFEYLN